MTNRLALMLITLLGATLMYLGLAVLSWGRFAAFFSQPVLVVLTIATFALSGAALSSKRR
jgi:fumarate reductase subunit C